MLECGKACETNMGFSIGDEVDLFENFGTWSDPFYEWT